MPTVLAAPEFSYRRSRFNGIPSRDEHAETSFRRVGRGQLEEAASMGPRSHERGNATLVACTEVTQVVLQWGRVLTNAETLRGFFDQPVVRLASMGPRSHERGNFGVSVHDVIEHLASMGPRSHERGNSANSKS